MSFLLEMECEVCIMTSYLHVKSYAMTRDQFFKQFGEQYMIHNSTIKRIMDWFLNEHRIDNVPYNGWPVTASTTERMEEIREWILIHLAYWDLNLKFQMLVALCVITTSEWSRSELL